VPTGVPSTRVTGSTPRPAEAIHSSSQLSISRASSGQTWLGNQPLASSSTASRDVPGRMRWSFGGVTSVPPTHRNTELEEPSSSRPSRTSSASSAPRSAASCRSSTLASSATDLMSQRSQRMSSSVAAASPDSSTRGSGEG